jgi:hypothetical protein
VSHIAYASTRPSKMTRLAIFVALAIGGLTIIGAYMERDKHNLPAPPVVSTSVANQSVKPLPHDYLTNLKVLEFQAGSAIYSSGIVLYTGQEFHQDHPCLIKSAFTGGIVYGSDFIVASSADSLPAGLSECNPAAATYPDPYKVNGGGLPGMFGVQRFEKDDPISGLIVLEDGTTYAPACSFAHAPKAGTSHGGGILGFDPNLPLCQEP